MTVAEPPRQPSPDENRAIMDIVEGKWNAGRGCYAGTCSDKSIAERMGVPWAWVAHIRTTFFGPDDVCEIRLDGIAGLDALIVRAQELQERGLQLAVDAERWEADARALRKAAGR